MNNQRHEMTLKRVVYELPGMDAVKVSRDVKYATVEGVNLTMDVYYPSDRHSEDTQPAVLFVSGYPDSGMQNILGCKLKEMESYISWAQLAAASGLVGITYTNHEPSDVYALFQFLQENVASLGIDKRRIGVWACSGNVPTALSLLISEASDQIKCAVLCYGYMLDADGTTIVSDAAKQWGFANPCSGKTVAVLPKAVPLFIVRSGNDQMPRLNETIDSFIKEALLCNLPLIFVNYPNGSHAFDLLDGSTTSRRIIKQMLEFMQSNLQV